MIANPQLTEIVTRGSPKRFPKSQRFNLLELSINEHVITSTENQNSWFYSLIFIITLNPGRKFKNILFCFLLWFQTFKIFISRISSPILGRKPPYELTIRVNYSRDFKKTPNLPF